MIPAASCASRLIARCPTVARSGSTSSGGRAPSARGRRSRRCSRSRAARASRRPPTGRRGSSCGGPSPPAATCSSSISAERAGRSRSTAPPSGATSSATSTAPPAALRSSGRRATPTTRPNRCRTWPRCSAPSTSGTSTSTATPTARMRPRRSHFATRGSCGRSCSTGRISCQAPTRRWPTSPRARAARFGWRAGAAPDARPERPTPCGSSRGSSPASAAIRSLVQRLTGTARRPMSASTRTRSSRF